MICAENDTFQDIMISSVMLPNAAGNALEKALEANIEGKYLSLKVTELNLRKRNARFWDWVKISSVLLVGCSESVALLSEEDSGRHRGGLFVVDGRGHYFECLILVCLDC